MSYSEEQKAEQARKELEKTKEAFPGLSFAENEQADLQDEIEIFYLWEENEKVFELYKILRNYLNEYYGLPENILLELIKEEKLPLKETLTKIPFIHSGFLDVVVPKGDSNGEQSLNS